MTTESLRVARVARVAKVAPRRRRPSALRSLSWAYIIAVIAVTAFPFYWMLRTALSNNYALDTKPSSLLPVGLTLGPFERVFGLATPAQAIAQGGSGASVPFARAFLNSVIYASVVTVCVVFFSTLAAYAFARLEWRGRSIMFRLVLFALMVPGLMTFLPNFLFIKDLGLLNTYPGLILPGALFSAFDIFFLRQFMLGLSREIEEAALIDGAGKLRILFRISIPLTSGPIATLCILGFISMWNDYFWPLLVTSNNEMAPLTLALGVFQQASPESMPDWAGLMAATLVSALPMLVLFMICGRKIINSIGFTGMK
jgi:multiple sugar transport system permease protein